MIKGYTYDLLGQISDLTLCSRMSYSYYLCTPSRIKYASCDESQPRKTFFCAN